MEKIIRTLLILLLTTHVGSATIHRINNNAGLGDYSSIQAANNDDSNVLAGDTLILEGSALLYSGAALDKRLVIIGPGYFLSKNIGTTASASEAIMDASISFQAGSEGSIIIGLRFGLNFSTDPRPIVRTDNITIMRCLLSYGIEIDNSLNNLYIFGNYFQDNSSGWNAIEYNFSSDPRVTNIVFKNNIVADDFENDNSSSVEVFSEISNNTFLQDCKVSRAGIFRNNIWGAFIESATISIQAAVLENNLAQNSRLGTENGNKSFDFTNSTDITFGNRSGRSDDQQWELASDSPFKGMGTDGFDPGAFGGSNPYVLSGVPPIPVIYEISTTGFGNQETGLPVTIKVRSN